MHNPDFPKLAEAMGVKGLSVSTEDKLPGAIREMLAHPGPVVLDAKVRRRGAFANTPRKF